MKTHLDSCVSVPSVLQKVDDDEKGWLGGYVVLWSLHPLTPSFFHLFESHQEIGSTSDPSRRGAIFCRCMTSRPRHLTITFLPRLV